MPGRLLSNLRPSPAPSQRVSAGLLCFTPCFTPYCAVIRLSALQSGYPVPSNVVLERRRLTPTNGLVYFPAGVAFPYLRCRSCQLCRCTVTGLAPGNRIQ